MAAPGQEAGNRKSKRHMPVFFLLPVSAHFVNWSRAAAGVAKKGRGEAAGSICARLYANLGVRSFQGFPSGWILIMEESSICGHG
jgi:hypothetical protein